MRIQLCLTILIVVLWSSLAVAGHEPDEIIIKFKPVKSSNIIAFEKVNRLNDMPLSYRMVLKALDAKELKPLYRQKTAVVVDETNQKIFAQSLQKELTKLDLKRINRIQRYLESKVQRGDDRVFVLKLQPGSDLEKVIDQLQKQPEVESVQKNFIYQTFATPNDPLYSSNQQTAFNQSHMNIANAWDVTTGNGTVVIAVIDTGFKLNHTDLSGQFWVNPGETASDGLDNDNNGFVDDINGWNFWDNNSNLLNTACSHGTGVASIIAAKANNSSFMAGVNWNAKVMALRVFSSGCGANTSQIIDAIDYAMQNGADIINMSLGGTGNDISLQNICQQAYSSGIVLVASMGNACVGGSPGCPVTISKDTLIYPAAYSSVIGVGSVSQSLQPSSFSVRGIDPLTTEITAIGESMCIAKDDTISTVVCNGSGTSFSTPVISGVASLLLTKEPGLTPLQVRTRLQNTATDVYTSGYDIDTGYGVVNAYNALTNTVVTINAQSYHLDNLRHYPNPTSGPDITFVYDLDQPASEVVLRIFDLRGRLLLQKSLGGGVVGKNTYPYDLKINGQKLAVGTYVYQIEAVVNGNKVRQIERFSVI